MGTDDGLVQISENGGATWRKIDRFPGVPDLTYVTDIFPSPHDANTVFVTLNDFHRGNFKPYMLKSTDLGRTWTPVAGDLPANDPGVDRGAGSRESQPAVRRHRVRPVLHGGWRRTLDQAARRDAGDTDSRPGDSEARERPGGGLVRPRLLRAGRFCRAAAVDARDAVRKRPQCLRPGARRASSKRSATTARRATNRASPNPPGGRSQPGICVRIRASLIVLTVTDAAGKTLRTLGGSRIAGIHRTAWDLRESAPSAPGGRGGGIRQGPLVKPGIYSSRLPVGKRRNHPSE